MTDILRKLLCLLEQERMTQFREEYLETVGGAPKEDDDPINEAVMAVFPAIT